MRNIGPPIRGHFRERFLERIISLYLTVIIHPPVIFCVKFATTLSYGWLIDILMVVFCGVVDRVSRDIISWNLWKI